MSDILCINKNNFANEDVTACLSQVAITLNDPKIAKGTENWNYMPKQNQTQMQTSNFLSPTSN